MVRWALIGVVAMKCGAASLNLMPAPWKASAGTGSLAIDSGFRVAAKGYSDARLEAAMGRLESRISRQTGVPLVSDKQAQAVLLVECREGGSPYPTLGEDESYQLDVAPEGARLHAQTVTGALRGLATFAQLIQPSVNRDDGGFQASAIHIEDRPRFPWRGLMLDVSRHAMPVEVIERNLDAMAAVKLNVFHWHLSDDQGFRVESLLYPKLHELGSDGHFYTQAEVRHVVDYARDRGIRVIPEFDIPGHTTAWFVGYPELASAPGPYAIERTWGIFQPTMDPSREATYAFLDGFIGEMAALFPDPYFHIGGDEVDDTQWKNSPAIQAFAREHQLNGSHAIHAYFNRRVQELIGKHGKTMIGWDEVFGPGLESGTVIQSWQGQASLAAAARQGYRGILSYGYYLDHMRPAGFHYGIDPLDGAASALDPRQASLILGGEACMWVEYASAETVDSRVWPRAAAIAERFWSPRNVTDVQSMYTRMEAVSRGLDWVGIQHRRGYASMLDRLTGAQTSDAVRVLADASEATGIEVRRDARKYTSMVHLNRFADAVRPESETVRRLEQAVGRAAADPAELAELRARFRQWADNDARLEPLAGGNAFVSELQSLSRNLAAVGAMGLRALEYLEAAQTAPEEWVAEQKKALDAMEKPNAEVVLAAVRPVRLLLNAVSRTGNKISKRG
jgi:hexosaminidase